MAIQSGVWGIDLGQCALKALRVEGSDGQVTATAFDYVEHPKILSQPDADPDQLIREALDKFLSRNSLRGDTVAISVPGQSGLARFVKLPPVEEKKIVDIVRFEAKQQIPFNLDEVVWDYQKIGAGMVTDGFAMDTEVGLFAIKRDIINNALQHFKDVNVEVHIVQMAPLALCNFVSHDLLEENEGQEAGAKKPCVVALDIGADSSNLVITDGRHIIWQRHIPLGGNHFTRALTKDLKLTFAKAEHLKRNATKAVDKNVDLKKILSALKPVLNDFVGEVQRSLGYFTNTHRDAQIEYMVGLGNAFRLPGLQRFLGEKLQLDVRKLTKLQRLVGDDVVTKAAFTDNVLSFAVAYGLAVQGLRLGRLHTNLLPPEIRTERMVRAKKPWAAAAAAALLLGTGSLALGYAMDYRSFAAPAVLEAMKDANGVDNKPASNPNCVVSLAQKGKKSFDDEKATVDKETKAVKSIIAGYDERVDWMQLHKFINQCLPMPDPRPPVRGNLWLPRAQNLYATQEATLTAFKKLLDRQSGIKPEDNADPEDGVDDLIQVNIEAVDARFTKDLNAYWEQLKAKPEFATGISTTIRPVEDKDKAPEKAGWVIELRGYASHRNKVQFVIDSLVENIAAHIRRAPAPAPGQPEQGANAQQTTAAPAKDEDPVPAQVSHVLLYKGEANPASSFISSGVVGSLVTSAAPGQQTSAPGGAASQGPMMVGMKGGGMGGGGGDWSPLTSSGSRGGTGPGDRGYGMSGSSPPGGSAPPGGKTGPMTGSMPPVPGTEQPATTRPYKHDRTEFVVLFIWKEATPSDELMKLTEESTQSGSTSPGGMPGGGMPGSGMPGSGSPPGGSSPPGGGAPGGSKPDDLSLERGVK